MAMTATIFFMNVSTQGAVSTVLPQHFLREKKKMIEGSKLLQKERKIAKCWVFRAHVTHRVFLPEVYTMPNYKSSVAGIGDNYCPSRRSTPQNSDRRRSK